MTQGRVVAEANSEINTIKASENATSIIVESNSASAVIGGILDTNNKIDNKVQGVQEVTETNDGFAGGLGTENSPYLISNEEEFRNINALTKSSYFLQINDIEINSTSASNSICIKNFVGVYNGNNFTINYNYVNSTAYCSTLFYNVLTGIIVDLKVNFAPTNNINGQAAIIVMEGVDLTFKNVDVYGNLNYSFDGRNQSPYLYSSTKTIFENCDAYCNIYTESYNSVFYGYPMGGQNLTLNNCCFYGEIVGDNVALLFANSNEYNNSNGKMNVTISNLKNEGTIYGYSYASLSFAKSGPSDEEILNSQIVSNNNVKVIEKLTGFSINIEGNQIVVTPADSLDVAYYKVELSQYVTWYYPDKNNYGVGTTMIGLSKIVNKDQISTLDLKYYEFRQTLDDLNQTFINHDSLKYVLNDNDYSIIDSSFDDYFNLVKSGEEYYYLLKNNITGVNGDEYIVISNPKPSVVVYAYDANGNMLGIVRK